jgi:hypothetical protein
MVTRHECDGLVRVEGQLDVFGWYGHYVDIKPEEDRVDHTMLGPSMPRRDDMAVWKHSSNVRHRRYDEMVLTKQGGRLRIFSL